MMAAKTWSTNMKKFKTGDRVEAYGQKGWVATDYFAGDHVPVVFDNSTMTDWIHTCNLKLSPRFVVGKTYKNVDVDYFYQVVDIDTNGRALCWVLKDGKIVTGTVLSNPENYEEVE